MAFPFNGDIFQPLSGSGYCDHHERYHCSCGGQSAPRPAPVSPENTGNVVAFAGQEPFSFNGSHDPDDFVLEDFVNIPQEETSDSPDNIYEFLEDVPARKPYGSLTLGSSTQNLALPRSLGAAGKPSRQQRDLSAAPAARGVRIQRVPSSQSSRSQRDPDSRYAPDFVSVSDSSRTRWQSKPPIVLQGAQVCYDELMLLLKQGFKKQDLNRDPYFSSVVPALAALESSAKAMYQCRPSPHENTKLTYEKLISITYSPQYRDYATSVLDRRGIPEDQYEAVLQKEFGVGAFSEDFQDIRSEEALAAIVACHDDRWGGSHRVGIIEETGRLENKKPVYDISVIPDGRDQLSLCEPYLIVWIYRSKGESDSENPARWSTMSSNSSIESEVFCKSCWKSFTGDKPMQSHRKQTHEEEEFECDVCHEIVKGERNLKRHKSDQHDKKRTQCNKCSYRGRKDNVARHKMAKHEKGKYTPGGRRSLSSSYGLQPQAHLGSALNFTADMEPCERQNSFPHRSS